MSASTGGNSGPVDTIVVGGGAVGICSALALQQTGRAVTVFERSAPGDGASGHNGGCFSVGDCSPVATPEVVRSVPTMLRDPLSPLALRWAYLPRLSPWLLRFVLAGRRTEVERISGIIVKLMEAAIPAYQHLLADSAALSLLKPSGMLYGFRTDESFAGARSGLRLRERRGTTFTVVDNADIAELDPFLDGRFKHGIYLPKAHHTPDPGEFTRALAQTFLDRGGKIETTTVTGFDGSDSRLHGVRTTSGRRSAGEVVLAAGAWSRRLARELGARVPLDTERGYGVKLPHAGFELRFPVISDDYHISVSPEPRGVRLTGMDELAGLHAPAKQDKAQRVSKAARQIFPELDTRESEWWMSYRPSMPDSLPVIGRAPRYENAYLAFGHGHKGLGQGAITGRLVQQLADGSMPSIDLESFRPDRFLLTRSGRGASTTPAR